MSMLVAQSCLTFLQPCGLQPARLLSPCSYPGKNTGVGSHFILMTSSRSWDQTQISCIAGRFLTVWATWEATWGSIQLYAYPLTHQVVHTKYIQLFTCQLYFNRASLVAQLVKNPTAMWETWVQSLGWEDPLEMGKATHSSILAWRIPWTV